MQKLKQKSYTCTNNLTCMYMDIIVVAMLNQKKYHIGNLFKNIPVVHFLGKR